MTDIFNQFWPLGLTLTKTGLSYASLYSRKHILVNTINIILSIILINDLIKDKQYCINGFRSQMIIISNIQEFAHLQSNEVDHWRHYIVQRAAVRFRWMTACVIECHWVLLLWFFIKRDRRCLVWPTLHRIWQISSVSELSLDETWNKCQLKTI